MVSLELALKGARQAPDSEIEAGRIELTLVPAPRDEVEDASASDSDVVGRAADMRIALSASLVRQRPRVADAADDESGAHPLHCVRVSREPRDRADSAGDEEEPV